MWAQVPIIGWLISFILNLFLTIPTYYLWNYIAPKYLYFIPEKYQVLPFWDILWIIMLISIVKYVLFSGLLSAKVENNTN